MAMKMLLFSFLLVLLNFKAFECLQTAYILFHERCDVSFNKSLVYNTSSKCYKLSRNQLYMNFSFNSNVTIDSDNVGEIAVVGYQFRSNEYRKGPIDFKMGWCSGLKRHDLDIPNMIVFSNMQCPVIRNKHYYAYKVQPNPRNLPPFIPEDRWKMEVKFNFKMSTLLTFNWYAKVYYPVIIKHT